MSWNETDPGPNLFTFRTSESYRDQSGLHEQRDGTVSNRTQQHVLKRPYLYKEYPLGNTKSDGGIWRDISRYDTSAAQNDVVALSLVRGQG